MDISVAYTCRRRAAAVVEVPVVVPCAVQSTQCPEKYALPRPKRQIKGKLIHILYYITDTSY